jgi:diadenosine tetraphosphatase ApaH/serine/threonine PP2A family protein phosphatase
MEDAAQVGYQAVWCLGDMVGYGPEPDECVSRIRQLSPMAVVGNHDWAVLGRMGVNDFNPEAGRAILWTRNSLSPANLAWLGELPSRPILWGQYTLTHGSPRDPVWEYIQKPAVALQNFDFFGNRFCLVGHTHVPVVYAKPERGGPQLLTPRPGTPIVLGGGARAILNPGSVGQPRDNDPRAAYAILDTDEATWTSHRVAYPIEITQARMRAARLPERLINRLSFGW